MRIWSVHPSYLDAKGLVALWRETLLAKNVLEGNTKGYKNHPQLIRFKSSPAPLDCINYYLEQVYLESLQRGYHFNERKFTTSQRPMRLDLTRGQMDYEVQHLLQKLKVRDVTKYEQLLNEQQVIPHPLFAIIKGGIAPWEIV